MASLDDTLGAVGYAKVICVLAPGAAFMPPAEFGAGSLETSLNESFVIPNEALAESLVGAARRARPPMRDRRRRPRPADWMSRVQVFPNLNLAIGYADRSSVEALRSDARIERVVEAPELSLIRPTSVVVAMPAPGPTWGISRLNVPALWAGGVTGEGVVVGHVDTGIDATHAALAGALHGFAEYDLTGRRVPNAQPRDGGQHGTHTAGIVAGRAAAGSARFGVAPGCRLASALAIENGQVIDRILGGLDWIVGEGARILSMSLGLRGYTPAFEAIIDALLKANVLPIVAVGNEFANTSRSPGNYPDVISVGACGPDDTVPDFSSSQSFARADDPIVPDLVAPGVGIVSCMPQNGFAEMDGSSMATPHVAGLAALLLQALPTATASDLQAAIFASCRRPATMPAERGNRGIPDAVAAYVELVGAPVPAAVA